MPDETKNWWDSRDEWTLIPSEYRWVWGVSDRVTLVNWRLRHFIEFDISWWPRIPLCRRAFQVFRREDYNSDWWGVIHLWKLSGSLRLDLQT
jgi:hypothetical protein